MIDMRTPISTGDTTVLLPYHPRLAPLKTRLLAREWEERMSKKKDLENSGEFKQELIKNLLSTLADDREFMRDEFKAVRKEHTEEMTGVYARLEKNALNHTDLSARVRIYEKLFWIVVGAVVTLGIPKLIDLFKYLGGLI